MEWTRGALMFYGGIAGALLTLLAAIIVLVILKRSRKRIILKLNDEYGDNSKITLTSNVRGLPI